MNLPELQTYIQVNNISKNQLEKAYLCVLSGDFAMETKSVIWFISQEILQIIWNEQISWTQMRDSLFSVSENYEAMEHLTRVFKRLQIAEEYLELFLQHKNWNIWYDILIKIAYEYEIFHFYSWKNNQLTSEEANTIISLLENLGAELVSIDLSYSTADLYNIVRANDYITEQEKQYVLTFLAANEAHEIDVYMGKQWVISFSNQLPNFQEDFAKLFQKEQKNITSIILI